jgi:hypothetical protein
MFNPDEPEPPFLKSTPSLKSSDDGQLSSRLKLRAWAEPANTSMAQAQELGADLLVKGAYTQSRLRQMIFGGPTQHILEHAELPVLMAH